MKNILFFVFVLINSIGYSQTIKFTNQVRQTRIGSIYRLQLDTAFSGDWRNLATENYVQGYVNSHAGATTDSSNLYVQWPLKMLNDSTIKIDQADATHDGYLDSLDYARLFTRQSLSNPTGTLTLNIDAGGQAGIDFTSSGGRTLAFSNLRSGDVFKITFNNTSGATITLTLPSNSFVAGTGSAGTIDIATGRSMLTMSDYDGTNYLFALQSY